MGTGLKILDKVLSQGGKPKINSDLDGIQDYSHLSLMERTIMEKWQIEKYKRQSRSCQKFSRN
jgi:hypothetical protein